MTQDDDSLFDFMQNDEQREISVYDASKINNVKVDKLPKDSQDILCKIKPGFETSNPR